MVTSAQVLSDWGFKVRSQIYLLFILTVGPVHGNCLSIQSNDFHWRSWKDGTNQLWLIGGFPDVTRSVAKSRIPATKPVKLGFYEDIV